jgi:DNA-binding IclR family transcriptional regulator
LAQRLDLPKTSLMRILSALLESGFVVQAPGKRGFVLGPHASRLAVDMLSTPQFSRETRRILARLVESTGESCNLTAPEGDSMRYLARVETPHLLCLSMEVGSHVPLHCTATGKLFLALTDEMARETILDRIPLSRHTPKTLVDRQKLTRELVTIRKRRVGIDNEEFVVGMVAVAVPVMDAKGEMIAAVSCHGPTARVSLSTLSGAVPVMRDVATAVNKVM